MLSCDGVILEANNIVKVCHEIQDNLNFSKRKEVFEFLALLEARKPFYTAAGYFPLKKSTLLTLSSAATTYFIIVVQFHES